MQRSFFSDHSARIGIFVACFFVLLNVSASDVTLTISELGDQPSQAGSAGFWLNALNSSNEETSWKAPSEIKCRLTSQRGTAEVIAKPRGLSGAEAVVIAPGSFVRRDYTLPIPGEWKGDVALELSELGNLQLVLKASPDLPAPAVEPTRKGMVYFLKGRKFSENGRYDPETFFKEHFFGYEPFYFVAGTESPNAKFQISFKYRLLNDHGWLAEKAPLLSGFHVAYSQTSLWDWNAASAPFFDSSYRPEFLYSWDRIVGGEPTNWFQLDFQTGVQHESNGRSEPESRSLNIAYLRPRLTFGKDSGLQLTLTPRAWVYIGDLSDNPDMADYRGYADLRAAIGWKRGLQVSALGRIGQRLSQGSVTVDATYPLMQPPSGSFSVYLMAQYFVGYGESLIGYKERTEIFRAGFSLFR